jgi:hypothetical protein
MKKLAALACLMLMPVSFAQDSGLAPKWHEFCPTHYCDAQLGDEPQYNRLGNGLAAMTIIGAPFVARNRRKYVEQDLSNYWARRRAAFENEIKLCESEQTGRAMCYLQVRQMEDNKNAQYKARILQQEQVNAIRRSNISRPTNCRSVSDGYGGFRTTCY